jgi:Putative peptidoglycan binding domain
MKRLITLATVLLVGLASIQAAQTDDQQKKKKKKAQTTQATSAQTSSRGQTSNRRGSSQTTTKPQVSAQTSKTHVSAQTSSNQQVTNRYYKNKKAQSNVAANTNYNQRNTQVVQTNKSKKGKKQTYVVTNNNAQWNEKAWKHYKRTGNELSFSQAQRWNWHQRHERDWWRRNNYRLVLYGGGYWYWNSGWWYPAYGYDPYYSRYVYDGPIFGYGYAAPGDVTAQVQRSLAQQGYYYGAIDGILGPGTRSAIQRYQIDHGLAVTAAIDEQTLYTLGLT